MHDLEEQRPGFGLRCQVDCGCCCHALPSAYFSDIRYVVTASKSFWFKCIAGISAPGFRESGSSIHCLRFSRVVGNAPEASVSRLAMCVKSGPKRPFAPVPAIVWQFMHALCSKTVFPASSSGE